MTTISEAIQNRQLLELRYHGYSRVVEPYTHGRNKAGESLLLCYQISGGSESGQRYGWKMLKTADVQSVRELPDRFTPRADYKKDNKAIIFVICQL